MSVQELPIDDVVLDPELNLRDALDPETVDRYAESWELMPPVSVFEVEGRWLLVDGFHRHAAAIRQGRQSIEANIHLGSYTEALDFAAGANLTHGLPLRRTERRRAIELKLRLHPDYSDRRLAKESGVSRELVARVRHDLSTAGQIPTVQERVGADGKTYTTAGLPRDPNEHAPADGPSASDFDDEPGREEREEEGAGRRGRGRRSREEETGLDPGGEQSPSESILADLARRDAAPASTATIDEMLGLMARQVMEVVTWVESEGFAEAYQSAQQRQRSLFQAAVQTLVERAGQLG